MNVSQKAPHFRYDLVCTGADGEIKWTESFENLVTTEGKNDIINKYFKGSGYTAAWFLGLKGVGTVAAGDTLATHAGWAELTPYTGNRPALAFGTPSAGSSVATGIAYTITSGATVAGAFVASVNTGASGILYSAGDAVSSRAVLSGDVLTVTLTVTFT